MKLQSWSLALLFFVGMGFLIGGACGVSAEDAETKSGKTTEQIDIPLKLWQIPDPKDTSPFAQADLSVLKSFCRKFPHVRPFAFSGITINNNSMDSAPLLAIAGGNSADILYVNFRISDSYISKSFLYPLDDFIKRDMTEEELKLRIAPAVWQVIKRDGPTVDKYKAGEHIWMMPYGHSVRTLCYRKDFFEAAGLDPDKPPKNWKELYEYAKVLADPANGRYGIYLSTGPMEAWEWIAFLWSAGGEAVEKDPKTGEWKASFNGPAAVESLKFYLKITMERWVDEYGNRQMGYAYRTGDPKAWGEGRIGMMSMYLDSKSIASGANIDPSLLGIAPFPVGPTGLRGTELNSTMMGLFSGIQGRRNAKGQYVSADKVREAAWQYMRFYDSEEARKIRVDKMVELGCAKMVNPIWLRKYGYADYAKFAPSGWEEVFLEALKCGKPEPYGKNCQRVFEFMTYPMEEIANRIRADENFMNSPDYDKAIAEALDKAVAKTNRYMIGKISPEEKATQNKVAGIVAIIILTMFSGVVYKVWSMFTPKNSTRKGWGFRKYYPAYIILLPAVLSIILWNYTPMVTGSRLAFLDYRFIGESDFVGMNNFARVLFSADWWGSLWNTLRYMFLLLMLGFWPPIVLAIMLQEVSHFKILYRVLYYLPAVMSGLVVIYLWKLFFEPGSFGILNQMILGVANLFGTKSVEPIAWLLDPRWAMLCCVIPTVWAGAGPGCLIYLAALKGIPPDLYEAADIDGCSFLQKIRFISMPSIKALIVINFIGAFIAAAQGSQMILVMTYGMANTEVAELHIFKEAYMSLRFGTAICMAWMLGVTLLMFTTYQLKMLSRVEFKAAASEGKG